MSKIDNALKEPVPYVAYNNIRIAKDVDHKIKCISQDTKEPYDEVLNNLLQLAFVILDAKKKREGMI